MSTQDFATMYSQTRHPVTGVTYFLIPLRKGKINFVRLKEKLEGRYDIEEFFEDTIEKDIEEGEELYIPEVFKDKEREQIILKTSIDKVVLTLSSLFGKATIDKPVVMSYRGYRILIIETTEIHFLILEDEKTKKHYLVIFGSRANSKNMLIRLNKFLEKIGLFAVPAILDPTKIESIRTQLKGELIDTTLDRFPSLTIRKKRIFGRGFQNEESYIRDAEISSVHQHMFEFKSGVKSSPKVIILSEDALVRFYSSITCKDYEWFLREYIFPHLRQIKKIPTTPLVALTVSDDIFEIEKED